jgi:signal transduction histidine kinase
LIEDQASAPAVEAFAKEFETDLNSRSSEPIEFYRESLDTILIPEGDYQSEVKDWYERKYSKRKLDLIVAVGPESHRFVEEQHQRFFPGVPILFSVDLKPDSENATDKAYSAGVWMDFDAVSTVDAARRLLPGTKHVVVVAGSGIFDQSLTKSVKTKLQGYQGVDFTYLTDLDMTSLLKTVHTLSEDTVLLCLTLTRDRTGQHMFSSIAMPLIAAATNVPAFGMIDLYAERGAIVGGRVTSFSAGAPAATDIALRFLRGESPKNVPSVVVPNYYLFDWKEMRRWRLDLSRVPAGSVVMNRTPDLWQEYWRIILGVLTILLLQAAILMYLLIERRKRRRAQQALEDDIVERKKAEASLIDLSSRLINAQEDEQSRIARELHDDFNQRIAILAVELKRTARLAIKDPTGTSRRIDELYEVTGDIAGDLHKFSHHLHSSVLDSLGLVEGIHSLCADFSAQLDWEVEFTAEEIPHNLPRQVSLSLYRVAQEGLRNMQKHSGATKAFVALRANCREIVLTITDSGAGFDDGDPSFRAGLGLSSMKERMRNIGGTIEVRSQPRVGTKVSARLPIANLGETISLVKEPPQ